MRLFSLWAVFACLLCAPHFAVAAEKPLPEATRAELQAAWQAADKAAIAGPADIPLLDQAHLKLPARAAFIPRAAASRILQAMGNSASDSTQGLILHKDGSEPWIIVVRWIKEGYVRDGDAKEWEADALLQSLREGTEASNKQRVARGFPAMDIIGWVQPPLYDDRSHRLVWSLSSRDRGAPASAEQTINYNTYALGREGSFTLDLITGADRIAADKKVAHDILAALAYVPGRRYEDFSESTDKVAAYGLAALVGAVAIKKAGLLAVAGLLLLKVWKLLLVALIAGGAFIRRVFKPSTPAE